jgi:Protein of unknown function (DUF2848)
MSLVRHLPMMCWHGDRAESATIALDRLVIAGWTGRDRAAVDHHIHELAAIGVKPPATIPCYYHASVDLLSAATDLQFLGPDSSGEVEFVMVSLPDGLWIGLGSDHTDRKVEAFSVPVSKQLCHKPLAPQLWRFDDVAPHWDRLELRAHITENGVRKLYQEGTVAQMREPADLIAHYDKGDKLPPGTAMFGGTFAAIGGVRPASEFHMALVDPVLGRTISHSYRVHPLPIE